MQLNVIFLNDTAYVNGGAAYVAIMEANALAERGHNVTFFCCDDGGPDKPRELHPDIRLVSTGQPEILQGSRAKAFIQGIHNQRAATTLAKLLKEYNPANTVVHLHAWNKALSTSVLKPIKQQHFPLVCTLHDYTAACPNGTFYNYQQGTICPLKPMSLSCIGTNCDSRNYGHKLWRVGRRYTQQHWHGMPMSVDLILAPSVFARDIQVKNLPGDAPVEVLPNPVEVERNEPVRVTDNTDIYYVGRLSPEKGVHTFLEAAELLGITPVIIGDGPSAAKLMERHPNAKFRGWMPPYIVKEQIRKARVIVFPSILYENDPLIVKEAASMGIPMILSDVSAPTATFPHAKTSLHFQAGDSRSLAGALDELNSTPAYAERLGHAAYTQYWETPCTVERHVSSLERYYRNLIAKGTTQQYSD